MRKEGTKPPSILALTPSHRLDPGIAIAACRAGAIGILDLGYRLQADPVKKALTDLRRWTNGSPYWGIRWDMLHGRTRSLERLHELIQPPVPLLVLGGITWSERGGKNELEQARKLTARVLVEVGSATEAKQAQQAGCSGLIIKGQEAGGLTGRQTSFILLQQLFKQITVPYFLQGGVGEFTISAALVAGASGVVLSEQLWLTPEAPFSRNERQIWQKMDGSETVWLDLTDHGFRLFFRSPHHKNDHLTQKSIHISKADWGGLINLLEDSRPDSPIPLGQDIGLAHRMASRYVTVGRIIAALRESAQRGERPPHPSRILGEHAPLARTLGTRYPIVQGPMSHISDNLDFAKAVAKAGGLPMLALGLMDEKQIGELINNAKAELSGHPWGVGVLGFLDPKLRQQQSRLLLALRPPCAIIAGGKPAQVSEFESVGIKTYLHTPVPKLLEIYFHEGVRKFIFEGRECGGHVGPLTSFVLWESAMQILMRIPVEEAEKIQVLFAGGIHDSLSTAMVAAIAAPLAERGIQIGIIMGTAYLLTDEALATGAVGRQYQKQVLSCHRTVLLESAAGHAVRCVDTGYAAQFNRRRATLIRAGRSSEVVQRELESMNLESLGRVSGGKKSAINAKNGRGGLYLSGEVAILRDALVQMDELHRQTCRDYPRHFGAAKSQRRTRSPNRAPERNGIAIIGMAAMFPEAKNTREYWHNIINGRDVIREVSPERWDPAAYFDPDPQTADKVYSKWGGFINDVAFDPTDYGIPPASLAAIEPIQLLALKVAQQALADANLLNRPFPKQRTSVIFGLEQLHDLGIAYMFRTMLRHYLPMLEKVPAATQQYILESLFRKLPKWTGDTFPGVLGNIVAGRISNRLDLGGSNFTVDAACASSLAAVDTAIRQLHQGICDLALVGAVDAHNHAFAYLLFSKTMALSPRGRARPFDDGADGTVISEGVAAVVLKRLADAIRDGDRIYATIRGVGSSSDGRNRSLVAPYPAGQINALKRAYLEAGVDPQSVSLIEAHGTGTTIGDKVEIESLIEAFGSSAGRSQYCAIGSVKSMIGHCKAAAGMAGLIKTALALKHQVLPPTIGVSKPNSMINWQASPFYVNTEPRPWFAKDPQQPRRAGVSAFGFGGTNFHAVLEEYSDYRDMATSLDLNPRTAELFCWSRRTADELAGAIGLFSSRIAPFSQIDIIQLAYSLLLDEEKRPDAGEAARCRLTIVARNLNDLKEKLRLVADEMAGREPMVRNQGVFRSTDFLASDRQVCFLFPGQGSQQINMLRDLIMAHPDLARRCQRGNQLLQAYFDRPLSNFIFPLPTFSEDEKRQRQRELNQTNVAQPALGMIEMLAYRLLRQYGIKAHFAAGHSYGEYVALGYAGVFNDDQLLRLSAERGRLVRELTRRRPGTMAYIKADPDQVEKVLPKLPLPVYIANFNGPGHVIVAGEIEAVDEAVKVMNERGWPCRRIPVTAAFHTPAMTEVGRRLNELLRKLKLNKPDTRVFSNTTAGPYPETAAEIRRLLSRHILEPIQFVKQIRHMYQAGARVFIEIGPGSALCRMVDSILADVPHQAIAMSADHSGDWLAFANLLAQLQVLGIPLILERWFQNRGLKDLALEDFLAQSQKASYPADIVWRVNGGRAVPWREDSTKRGDQPQPPVADPPGGIPSSDDPEWQQLMSNVQELHAQQQHQQQLSERLLSMQEQLLAIYRKKQGLSGLPEPSSTDQQVKPKSARIVTGVTPPAPRLPDLPATMNDGPAATAKPMSAVLPTPESILVPEPSDRSTEPEVPSGDQFKSSLLQTVSERTGYPVSMLNLDLHLERDLGIDSIKLVEIVSTLRKYQDFLQIRDEEKFVDAFTSLKTLRSIIQWYEDNRTSLMTDKRAPAATPSPARDDNLPAQQVKRFILKTVAAPAKAVANPAFASNSGIFIFIGSESALAGMVIQEIRSRGHDVFQTETISLDTEALQRRLVDCGKPLRGIIKLNGQHRLASRPGLDSHGITDVTDLFSLLKTLAPELRESGKNGGGWLVNVSFMGGRFGLKSSREYRVGQAGCHGLLKAIAHEWPEMRIRCLDFDSTLPPKKMSQDIVDEIESSELAIEAGFDREGRWELAIDEPDDRHPAPAKRPQPANPLFLVTGGAYGIVAEVMRPLAAKYRPRLVITGRTPFTASEDETTRLIADSQRLRQFFIDKTGPDGSTVTPMQIEKQVQDVIRSRAVRRNLAAFQALGATVEYVQLDVRDRNRFAVLIDELYSRHGNIDGVIHGAGLIEDKLIQDKPLDSFSRVLDTKVVPALVLAEKLRPQSLGFLVFFSSIVARWGNAGQSDYCAANEILNKLAWQLGRQWPTRVTSINWGPWETGMISPELRRLYESRGIKLIAPEEGADWFLRELQASSSLGGETIITRSLDQIQRVANTR